MHISRAELERLALALGVRVAEARTIQDLKRVTLAAADARLVARGAAVDATEPAPPPLPGQLDDADDGGC